ncbi:MAG TPA: PPC domain-containing protein [Blastocatellia bacterium]|nr:PPC domain-containing protein [Blastocatellia bacterium]
MRMQSLKRSVAVTTLALLLTTTFVAAQSEEPALRIGRHTQQSKDYNRIVPALTLDRAAAFRRVNPSGAASASPRERRRTPLTDRATALSRTRQAATVETNSFGTGGGDIFEAEPNDRIAQGVSLPVNIFGRISFDGDVDFFSFRALAGQQITIEAFAARLRNSDLIADIVLFDTDGRMIDREVGDEDVDPLIRYTPFRDEVLIAGIADIDDFGGPRSDYMLNITRGDDVDEEEPNDRSAQRLPGLPVTIFGDIDGRTDVDFYSFVAVAGQTLIVDVDAEVLGSRLDPEVNLSDPETGVEYFYNDQYDGDDSRFNLVLPHTGRYVIGIGAFDSNSSGFYRLNASLVPAVAAPFVSRAIRLSRKTIEVSGSGFGSGSVVEVRSRGRSTSITIFGTLRAKVKARIGDVVTVANAPDDRRSNPVLVQ